MSLNNEGAQNLKQSDKETCEDRITEAIISRGEDFTRFMNCYSFGEDYINETDSEDEVLDEFYNYGLDISMVEIGTFRDQTEPYLRYQISYGGPSEELRFYQNGTVEFWFLDWFDGAHKIITSIEWVQWLKQYLEDIGLLTNEAFFKAWEGE
tara:strand:- start:868 stop:1323 length:456 start_codon:yes stop_codon:yes gene_type:complete